MSSTNLLPAYLNGNVTLLAGIVFPTYRILIIGTGLLVAAGLYFLVAHTRMGMLIRAGASNRMMVGALGIDIKLLYTLIFGLGAALAGLAGLMIAPITEATIGMGDDILIVAFVVVVIGGVGSVRGAFIAAILVQIGIFSTRWNVVIGCQLFSKSLRGLTVYKVQLFGLEGLLMTCFLLILPFVILYVLTKLFPPWQRPRVKTPSVLE